MFDSIIYDFDGTLCDTYPVFADVLLELLEEHGLHDSREKVLGYLKVTVGHALRQYEWGSDLKAIQREFNRRRAERVKDHKPFADTEEILRYAISAGKKNYIYTHTGHLVYDIIDGWGMRELFAGFVDGEMNFPMKPAPDALNFLMQKYSIDKNRALMVGDRDIDILAGRNAGLPGCLFDEGGYYPDFWCEFKVGCLSELKKII